MFLIFYVSRFPKSSLSECLSTKPCTKYLVQELVEKDSFKLVITQNTSNDLRSSGPEVHYKKGVLDSSLKFTGKYLYQRLSFKVADNFIIMRFRHRCFPMNFANFSKTPILQNICDQLLLQSLSTNNERVYSV